MNRLLIFLLLISSLFLTGCEPSIDEKKKEINPYEGELHYFDVEDVTSMSVQMAYFNNAFISMNNDGVNYHIFEGSSRYYYVHNDEVVVVRELEDNSYVGIISYNTITFELEAFYSEIDEIFDISLMVQVDYTNTFSYQDENMVYVIEVNEDNYITYIECTDLSDGSRVLTVSDINLVEIEVPEHDIYTPAEYVMETNYSTMDYTYQNDLLTITNDEWTVTINNSGRYVHFIHDGITWRYLDFVYEVMRDESNTEIAIDEFLIEHDTLDADFLSDIMDIVMYIEDIDTLFIESEETE